MKLLNNIVFPLLWLLSQAMVKEVHR